MFGITDLTGLITIEIPGERRVPGEIRIDSDGVITISLEDRQLAKELISELTNNKLWKLGLYYGRRD